MKSSSISTGQTCVFCNDHSAKLAVYSIEVGRLGICLHCAKKAIESLVIHNEVQGNSVNTTSNIHLLVEFATINYADFQEFLDAIHDIESTEAEIILDKMNAKISATEKV